MITAFYFAEKCFLDYVIRFVVDRGDCSLGIDPVHIYLYNV